MTPKVSVILYGFNYARYLNQAVESVLGQSFGDLELIATDNASTDGSQDILRSFAAKDSRVTLMLHADNVLCGSRWNAPLKIARGEFISLLNADDYYLPDKLRLQESCLSGLSSEHGLVYGPGYRLNDLTGERWLEETFRTQGEALEPMLREPDGGGPFYYSAPLVRRRLFERYPFVGEDYFEGEGIFYRFAMGYKFYYLDEPLIVLRDHLSNMGKAIKFNRKNFVAFMRHLMEQPEFPLRLRPLGKSFLAKNLRNYGWQGIRLAQDPEWSRGCFREAVAVEPSQALHPRIWAGFGLSLLPRSILNGLNSVFNALMRREGNVKMNDISDISRGGVH